MTAGDRRGSFKTGKWLIIFLVSMCMVVQLIHQTGFSGRQLRSTAIHVASDATLTNSEAAPNGRQSVAKTILLSENTRRSESADAAKLANTTKNLRGDSEVKQDPILSESAKPPHAKTSIRWRGNNYVKDDGILPWQRCGAHEFSPGPRPIFQKFTRKGQSYDLIVTAASVWGQSDDTTGEPVSVNMIEALAYMKPAGVPCPRDLGNHCSMTLPFDAPAISCTIIASGKEVRFVGKIITTEARVKEAFHFGEYNFVPVMQMQCPIPEHARRVVAEWTNQDSISVLVRLTDDDKGHYELHEPNKATTVKLDLCYEHVEAPAAMTICTEPMWGYKAHYDSPFWRGRPSFPEKCSLLDYFIQHHVGSLGLNMQLSDTFSDMRETVERHNGMYTDKRIYYRPGWAFTDLEHLNADSDEYLYAFETLAESTCAWENRFRSRWTMIVHSPDNYVLPVKEVAGEGWKQWMLSVLARIPATSVSSIIVPIVQSYTPQTHTDSMGNLNILQRWNLLGEELEFKHERATPMVNPRHVAYSIQHANHGWLSERFTKEVNHKDAVESIGLHTLHIMALARPNMDRHSGRRDTVLDAFASALTNTSCPR